MLQSILTLLYVQVLVVVQEALGLRKFSDQVEGSCLGPRPPRLSSPQQGYTVSTLYIAFVELSLVISRSL
jgi:hypothetical protein